MVHDQGRKRGESIGYVGVASILDGDQVMLQTSDYYINPQTQACEMTEAAYHKVHADFRASKGDATYPSRLIHSQLVPVVFVKDSMQHATDRMVQHTINRIKAE